MMRLEGKVCIVTGSAKGIGRATAEKFLNEGAKVLVCDVDKSAIDVCISSFEKFGNAALGCHVDVANRDSVAKMVELARIKFGAIDVLVNNAGIVRDARMMNMSEDQFDSVINVNLKGTYNCAQAVLPTMLEQQSGSIINVSSIVGIYGNFGQTNYAASKFGVIGMAKTWAREFARAGIRANAVCPGMVETDILKDIPPKVMDSIISRIPAGRLGKPEEVANVYAFLASDESKYVNGAVIEVGGGATL